MTETAAGTTGEEERERQIAAWTNGVSDVARQARFVNANGVVSTAVINYVASGMGIGIAGFAIVMLVYLWKITSSPEWPTFAGGIGFALLFLLACLAVDLTAVVNAGRTAGRIGDISLSACPAYLRVITGAVDVAVRWRSLLSIRRFGGDIYLFHAPYRAYVVPRRAFGSRADGDAAYDLFRRYREEDIARALARASKPDASVWPPPPEPAALVPLPATGPAFEPTESGQAYIAPEALMRIVHAEVWARMGSILVSSAILVVAAAGVLIWSGPSLAEEWLVPAIWIVIAILSPIFAWQRRIREYPKMTSGESIGFATDGIRARISRPDSEFAVGLDGIRKVSALRDLVRLTLGPDVSVYIPAAVFGGPERARAAAARLRSAAQAARTQRGGGK